MDLKYNGNLVHGRKVRVKDLVRTIGDIEGWSSGQWKAFRAYVNPNEQNSDGAERLVSGIIPLVDLLRRLDKDEFTVSALSTRFGMAWALARL